MAKCIKNVVEYRVYDLPLDIPVVLLEGEQWRISDIMSTRLHFHNCIEIGYCLSEAGSLVFENENLHFRTGDITIIPRHVPHTTCSQKGTKSLWSYLFLDLAAFITDLLPAKTLYDPGSSDWFPQTYLFSREEHPEIHFIAQRLLIEFRDKPAGWIEVARSLSLVLYHELIRMRASETAPKSEHETKSFVLKPALEYIHQNYMQQTNMKQLADICHLSETHFRRLFLSIMGTSPLSFINATRTSQACVLLDTTQLSIAEIAERVGISSIASFNRNFHQIMGVSPREYRNASSKANINPKQKYILTYKGWLFAEERPEYISDDDTPPPKQADL